MYNFHDSTDIYEHWIGIVLPIGCILQNVGMLLKILRYLIKVSMLLSNIRFSGIVSTFRRIHQFAEAWSVLYMIYNVCPKMRILHSAAPIPLIVVLPKTIQLGTHQILKLLFAQKESAPTASSPISIIIFQDQSQWGNFWVICNICWPKRFSSITNQVS